MLGTVFSGLRSAAPVASLLQPRSAAPLAGTIQARWASNLGPRRTKYRKAHKGRVQFPIGGSVKGTTVTQGLYGIRALEPCRLSAVQITAADTALKRKLKVVRGSQVFMRVFPDIPVCVKGNETRMGKGKGSFEYWACRYVDADQCSCWPRHFRDWWPYRSARGGRKRRFVLCLPALRLAAAKLPIRTEFIKKTTPPRLGREVSQNLAQPASS